MAPNRLRRSSHYNLVVLIAFVLVLVGCTTHATPTSGDVTVEFAVGQDPQGELVLISADGSLTPIVIDDAPVQSDRVIVLSAEHLGVLGQDELMVLGEGGLETHTPCPGCSGLALTPAGLVTAQESFIPGVDFQLVTFDEHLNETARVSAHFASSRVAPTLMPKMRVPTVEASINDTVIVSAISADGGEAGNGRLYGPWTLGYYTPDGRLDRHTEVPGPNGVGPVQVSPDGVYSAVIGRWVEGACHSGETVTLVDNESARVLDSDKMSAPDGEEQVQILTNRWSDGQYVIDAVVEYDETGSCNFKTTARQESIDPVTGAVTGHSIEGETVTVGNLGPGCDATLAEPAEKRTWDAEGHFQLNSAPLAGVAWILYAPIKSGCHG